jgi:hypothetical protein
MQVEVMGLNRQKFAEEDEVDVKMRRKSPNRQVAARDAKTKRMS